ncbi:hypothetical protein DPEC_G00313420 [Dallia pectoralis]|uniref:Uncharacterized protein n=1 Tax=Dallia pectoralis TaxID=75939 RepID=A0ACC2FC54_DALPE|nr:hypothetical protein DPEC_G00313420 [Dallia pectoralis]
MSAKLISPCAGNTAATILPQDPCRAEKRTQGSAHTWPRLRSSSVIPAPLTCHAKLPATSVSPLNPHKSRRFISLQRGATSFRPLDLSGTLCFIAEQIPISIPPSTPPRLNTHEDAESQTDADRPITSGHEQEEGKTRKGGAVCRQLLHAGTTAPFGQADAFAPGPLRGP